MEKSVISKKKPTKFETYNILRFEPADKENPIKEKFGSPTLQLRISNQSDWILKGIFYYCFLRDESNNIIGEVNGTLDGVVYPGTYFLSDVYLDEFKDSVDGLVDVCVEEYNFEIRKKGSNSKTLVRVNIPLESVESLQVTVD